MQFHFNLYLKISLLSSKPQIIKLFSKYAKYAIEHLYNECSVDL